MVTACPWQHSVALAGLTIRRVLTFDGHWDAQGAVDGRVGGSSAVTHSASRAEGGLGDQGSLRSSSLCDPRGREGKRPPQGHRATSAPTSIPRLRGTPPLGGENPRRRHRAPTPPPRRPPSARCTCSSRWRPALPCAPPLQSLQPNTGKVQG